MRYNYRQVFGKPGLLGFAYQAEGRVLVEYTVFLPYLVEPGHRPVPTAPTATDLEALKEADFPDYILDLYKPLSFGAVAVSDELPDEFDSLEKAWRFSDWFGDQAQDYLS